MRHALLRAWQKTVASQGALHAVVQAGDGRAVTFSELDRAGTHWCGQHLPNPAALAGQAVVFSAANGIGWFEIFLGLLKAGAAVVPLDAAEPPVVQRRLAESIRAGAWWDGNGLVPLPRAKHYRDPGICLIKLTSGSTGRPRPLVFTASQLLADGRQVTSTMGIGTRDLNYALIPLGHSYGLGNLTVPLLAQGIPLVCGASPLPHAIAADFARWHPTVFPGVPAVWRALAASAVALDSLRLGISAGAPLPVEVARDFAARFGRRLHSFYGSSETGGIAYDATGQATLAGGVGRALRGVKMTVRRGGWLKVSSEAVTTYGRRHASGKAGSWLMADRVKIDWQGRVTLVGRRGSTVKIAGRRVNLVEVRERIRRLPGVHDVWVGVKDGAEPILGVVVATERPVAELRVELHAYIAAWKIPKRWARLAEFSLTERGKTDVRALHTAVFS